MMSLFHASRLPVYLLPLALLALAAPALHGQQDTAAQEENVVRIFYMRYANTQTIGDVISTLYREDMDLSGVRLAVDENTNSIIVSGPQRFLEEVEALLMALDRGPEDVRPESDIGRARNVDVEVFWIADVSEANMDKFDGAFSEIPESIEILVKDRLHSRLSLENPKLVSHLLIQTVVPAEVNQAGRFEAASLGISGESGVVMSALGTLLHGSRDRYAIDLGLEIEVGSSFSQLQTSITTQLDHPVCLALAKTGELESLFIIRLSAVPEED